MTHDKPEPTDGPDFGDWAEVLLSHANRQQDFKEGVGKIANSLKAAHKQGYEKGVREGIEKAAKHADSKAKDIADWNAVARLKNMPREIRNILREVGE